MGLGDDLYTNIINLPQTTRLTDTKTIWETVGDTIEEAIGIIDTDVINRILTPVRKFLFYTGIPSRINNTQVDVDRALQFYFNFDNIVFKMPEDSNEQTRLKNIISEYRSKKTVGRIYGLIDLGVTTSNLSLSEISYQVGQWLSMGVDGVYYDNAGWDFQVTRERQNIATSFLRSSEKTIIWGSNRVDDIFEPFITENYELVGTGDIVVNLRSDYVVGANSLNLKLNGLPIFQGTGNNQYEEVTFSSILVHTTYTDPDLEVINRAGNAVIVSNPLSTSSQANNTDYWLYSPFLINGDYTPSTYGWTDLESLLRKSDRVKELKDNYGFSVLCLSIIDYDNMLLVNTDYIDWLEVQYEPIINDMLKVCYIWAVIYGFEGWGHIDPTYGDNDKIFPFSVPNIKFDIKTGGQIIHEDGPDYLGIYKKDAKTYRSYTGGFIFTLYNQLPGNEKQPLTYNFQDFFNTESDYSVNDRPTYDQLNEGFDASKGQGTYWTISPEDISDMVVDITNPGTNVAITIPIQENLSGSENKNIVQVSDDQANWYYIRNDGIDWKGNIATGNEGTEFECKLEKYIHTNIPLPLDEDQNPGILTLYYRAKRKQTLGTYSNNWSPVQSVTLQAIGTKDLVYHAITLAKMEENSVDGSVQVIDDTVIFRKLHVLAKEYINNFSRNFLNPNVIDPKVGWSNPSEWNLISANVDGVNAIVAEHTIFSGNSSVVSDKFEIDVNKIYEVKISFLEINTTGDKRFVIRAFDENSNPLTVDRYQYNGITKSWDFLDNLNNIYLGNPITWTHIKTYVVGASADIGSVPLTNETIYILKIPNNTIYLDVYWRIFGALSSTTLYVFSPSIIEMGSGRIITENLVAECIIADKIKAATITSVQVATGGLIAENIGGGELTSLNWSSTVGSYFNLNDGTFYLGGSDNPKLSWDGETLSIVGQIEILGGITGESFIEAWELPNPGNRWTNYDGSGEVSIINSADSVMGGNYIRFGNNSGNDQVWYVWNKSIPYDPSKLYRIRCRIRRPLGTGLAFLGVAGRNFNDTQWVNVNGNNLLSNSYYFAGSGFGPGTDWIVYEGYFKGVNIPGDGEYHPSPYDPGTVHENVKYIRPLILVNYNSQPGQTDVDFFSIDIIDDITVNRVGNSIDSSYSLISNVHPGLPAYPTGTGLFMGSDYLGFYNSTLLLWTAYIDSNGYFTFRDPTNTYYISWTGGVLSVRGNIQILSGSTGFGNITDVPTELTDGRIASALNINGTVISNVQPGNVASPTGTGLFMGSDYLGFYNSTLSVWTAYIDSGGNFYAGYGGGDINAGSFVWYNQGAGTITINATIWAGSKIKMENNQLIVAEYDLYNDTPVDYDRRVILTNDLIQWEIKIPGYSLFQNAFSIELTKISTPDVYLSNLKTPASRDIILEANRYLFLYSHSSAVFPYTSNTDLGSNTYRWNNFYVSNIDIKNNFFRQLAHNTILISGNSFSNIESFSGNFSAFCSASIKENSFIDRDTPKVYSSYVGGTGTTDVSIFNTNPVSLDFDYHASQE